MTSSVPPVYLPCPPVYLRCISRFVAYSRLAAAIAGDSISDRAVLVASYALCGFANLGSMGIMVGALHLPPSPYDLRTISL